MRKERRKDISNGIIRRFKCKFWNLNLNKRIYCDSRRCGLKCNRGMVKLYWTDIITKDYKRYENKNVAKT